MTMWNRIFPDELIDYQGQPNAVPLASGPFPHICPNCGGHEIMLVYVISSGPFRQPNGGKVKWLDYPEPGFYTGELKSAPCPVCQKGRMQAYLQKNCGLRDADLQKSLSDFRATGAFASKAEALDTARSFLAMNRQPHGWLTYYGDYGVGKSHLMMGLVNGFRQIGVVARYAPMSELLADIRERFGGDNGVREVENVIDDFRRARVLCIDEVDRVNLTGWAKETIFRLLNARYNESEKLLTVLGTNLAPRNLPPELGYLSSRMTSGVCIEVPGPDVRPIQGLKAHKELPNYDNTHEPSVDPPEPGERYDTRGLTGKLSAGLSNIPF